MRGRTAPSWRWLVPAAALVATIAGAEDSVTVGGVGVLPSTRQVEVAISADTDTPLTGLNLDLVFAPALCQRIASQRLELAERVRANDVPLPVDDAEALACPQGRRALVLVDLALRNAPAVVPAGDGEIARWLVTLNDAQGVLDVPMTLQVRQARNGAEDVALQVEDGGLIPTCVGDCAGDRTVAINELITGVGIALGSRPARACPAFDVDGNGAVAINELIAAVNNALSSTCTPLPS